jgi:hypothetical protein
MNQTQQEQFKTHQHKNQHVANYYLQNPFQTQKHSYSFMDRNVLQEPIYSGKSNKLMNESLPVQTSMHHIQLGENPFMDRSLHERPKATRMGGGGEMESIRNQEFMSPILRDHDMIQMWGNQNMYMDTMKPEDSRSVHYKQKQTFSEGANMVWNRNELLRQQQQPTQTPYMDRMMMKDTRS